MPGVDVLFDIVVLLLTALVLGAVCERLRQSAIVGYLLAGMLAAPRIASGNLELLGELGVGMFLFTIGLEFSWVRFRRLGRVALLGGALQVGLTAFVAGGVARLFGAGPATAATIGAILALSSTAVVLRVLVDRAQLDSVHGRYALGILLLQDVAIIPLVLLVELLSSERAPDEIALHLVKTIIAGTLLVALFVVLFNHIVPWLLGARIMALNRELATLLATVSALGAAWGAHEAELSPAIGSFIAGMLLGGSPFAVQIRADVSGLRTLLSTLFFTTVGTLADPRWIAEHWSEIAAVVVAVLAGKTLISWAVLRLLGIGGGHAFATALCLAQIGEFSLVLADSALDGAILSRDVFNLLISATIASMIVTPYLVAVAPRLGAVLGRRLRRAEAQQPPEPGAVPEPLILVVGFGPAGQGVAIALAGKGMAMHVVDLNPRIGELSLQYGCIGHVGDARQPDVLVHAGLRRAAVVVVTTPDPATAAQVIRRVRADAPTTRIVARSRYHIYRWELHLAGAHEVIDEEEHVGRRLAAESRKQLRQLKP